MCLARRCGLTSGCSLFRPSPCSSARASEAATAFEGLLMKVGLESVGFAVRDPVSLDRGAVTLVMSATREMIVTVWDRLATAREGGIGRRENEYRYSCLLPRGGGEREKIGDARDERYLFWKDVEVEIPNDIGCPGSTGSTLQCGDSHAASSRPDISPIAVPVPSCLQITLPTPAEYRCRPPDAGFP